MKVTRIGPSFPLLTASTLGGGGGSVTPSVGSGLVPVSTGSNSWAWGSNVQLITSNGSNALLGPFVNFASGSNIILAVSSNTINIAATAPDSLTTADYLVGTAQAGLSAEIVVGTAPGGELGNTWAAPTVDASHSGSTHAATQAAAEATAAAALAAHVASNTGEILISDTPVGSPLVFADLIQNEAQDDLLYGDI